MELMVNDTVAVRQGTFNGRPNLTVSKVSNVSDKYVWTSDGRVYRKDSGLEVGLEASKEFKIERVVLRTTFGYDEDFDEVYDELLMGGYLGPLESVA